MQHISFNFRHAMPFIPADTFASAEKDVLVAAGLLRNRNGQGNEFLGWLDLPAQYDRVEFDRIKQAAETIRSQSEVLLVIGIGGSYLGAKAALEFCNHHFFNNLPQARRGSPEIYFAGTNISGPYLHDLMSLVSERALTVNVISKSGTTTEPAIAFRIFKQHLEKEYGQVGARERIFATTDKMRGALKTLADREGYETFVVPDDVGGRFSVLTAVGLLPLACAGIDIDALMQGAADARERYLSAPFEQNEALQYAALRNALLRQGKDIELLVNYEPRCRFIAEWWKQLYGESEGKEGKGIFPASVDFTADLHSMGQYIQEGRRSIFETVLHIDTPQHNPNIPAAEDDLDGLNYLAGRSLDYVNKKAAEGTLLAHTEGGVPVLNLHVPEANPYHLGQLFYFFEYACAVSGYTLGVNPFDQPGVEAYKKNMFRLLGKP